MFGLDPGLSAILLLCIICACAFEFINGFHDTANAVATVIYTKSLPPVTAVIWSGLWNSAGVFAGLSVAMGIVNLLPIDTLVNQNFGESVAMILALLLSAIVWNLGTWWMGLPASSSHTLIGSILGIGIVYSLISGDYAMSGVNWSKASSIGLSLLISPLMGFGLALGLMVLMKKFSKDPDMFKAPKGKKPPKTWIRAMLIMCCTGVSFAHGSNDGQKGIGLVMLILISIAPLSFAIDPDRDPLQLEPHANLALEHIMKLDQAPMNSIDRAITDQVKAELFDMKQVIDRHKESGTIPREENFALRKDILFVSKHIGQLKNDGVFRSLSASEIKETQHSIGEMKKYVEYAPFWVVVMISISLGVGTTIGWKRIVVTIGEKIGKEHLTYAQGAAAEMVAATTVGLASVTGLPVSTTQVLSSGVAGAMVSSNGIRNLQGGTIRNIAIAWLLTLPVTTVLSGLLYWLFRMFV